MEPLNDDELNGLLKRWEAPDAPPQLEQRIFGSDRQPWYRWLLNGSIRVPVPVAAMLVVLLLSAWMLVRREPIGREPAFSDFQPVKDMNPRVIRSQYEGN